ncbi:MAG TPA: hypothetical protein VF939_15865 [Puia sp.]
MRSVYKSISHRALIMGSLAALLITTVWLSGCTPDKGSASLGPLPKASFTVAPVSGAVNTFALASGSQGVFGWYWDPGDGTGSKAGHASDTLYYSKHGNYRVILSVTGHGGYDTASQIVSVATDDPGINVLQGNSSGALDASSASAWTALNTGGAQTTFNFTAQGLNISNTGNTNGGVYQAVQVKAGVPYTFDATLQGAGASNSWLEFYLGTAAPAQGSDYSNNKYNSLNTWAGCGGSSFSGDINTIGCSGTGVGQGGKITFATSGTLYVVIKAGSAGGTLGTGGVMVTNISLRMPSH